MPDISSGYDLEIGRKKTSLEIAKQSQGFNPGNRFAISRDRSSGFFKKRKICGAKPPVNQRLKNYLVCLPAEVITVN